MLAADGTGQFLKCNRRIRRHEGHAVRIYRCEKELGLPFRQVGIPDAGQDSGELAPAIDDEKFLDIDIDNFDERIKAMKSHNKSVDTSGSDWRTQLMQGVSADNNDDLARVDMANKVDILRKLLDTRMQFRYLQHDAAGWKGVPDLILRLSNDKVLLNFLVQVGKKYDEDDCVAAPMNLDGMSGK